MKIQLLLPLAGLLILPLLASSQSQPSPEAEAFFTKAMLQINAKHVQWIKSTAKETNEKNLSTEDVMNKSRSYGVLGAMNDQDIEALAFLVLMQASKSAQEDLKAIMAKVKSINNQKSKQRELLSGMQKENTMSAINLDSFKLMSSRTKALQIGSNPDTIKFVRSASVKRTISKIDKDNMTGQIKNDFDSLSEMGEMESLLLQKTMDRMTKMDTALSNLLKKISDAAQGIIQNLK